MTDVDQLAQMLRETSEHHDAFEKAAPEHHWWDWYAAYMTSRQQGRTAEESSASAAEYMAGLGVVIEA